MPGVAKQPGPPLSRRGQSNSHIVALLSLKILLLAFFILLNSLASFEEERRAAVVDSVRQAFQGVLPAPFNLKASPAAIDIFDGGEQLVDELHRLFANDLPLIERGESPGSRILRVDLPASDLFAGDGGELMPEGAETLRMIAAVLDDRRFAGANYQVDVLYGLADGIETAEGRQAAVTRSGALVRGLENQGLRPQLLSAGLLPDFAGKVRFHFIIVQDAGPSASTGGEG